MKLSKSSWLFLQYSWDNRLLRLYYSTLLDLKIDHQPIPKNLSTTLSTILGIPFTHAGYATKLSNILQYKCRSFISKLTVTYLPPSDIIFRYHTYWWSALCYFAPVSSLPLQGNVLQNLYYIMLPRLKINRHFPKVMINLLYSLGEINLPRYQWEQAIQHLSFFLILYNNTLPMGDKFIVELKYCQLHVRTTICFLHISHVKYYNKIPQNLLSII